MRLAQQLEEAIQGLPWDDEVVEAKVPKGYAAAYRKGYIDLSSVVRDRAPDKALLSKVAADVYKVAVGTKRAQAFIKDPDNTLLWLGHSPSKLERSLMDMWGDDVERETEKWRDDAMDRHVEGDPTLDFDSAFAAIKNQRFDITRVRGRTGDGWKIQARYSSDDIRSLASGRLA